MGVSFIYETGQMVKMVWRKYISPTRKYDLLLAALEKSK